MATKLEEAPQSQAVLKNDIAIMVGGQGGDGTLTVVNLLAESFETLDSISMMRETYFPESGEATLTESSVPQ